MASMVAMAAMSDNSPRNSTKSGHYHGCSKDSEKDYVPHSLDTSSPSNSEPKIHHSADKEDAEPTSSEVRPFSKLRWIGTCFALLMQCALYGVDTTITANVQGPILQSLGHIEQLPWVGIGFLFGSVASTLPFGVLYGKFEIKWLYLGSIVLFEVGTAICGAAPNMNAMTVGRVIAGVGGAGMYIGCLNYFTIFTTLKERANYTAALAGLGVWVLFSDLSSAAPLRATIQPPGAGHSTSISASPVPWLRSFFFAMPRFAIPSGEPALHRLIKVDWLGTALHAAAYVLFITACTFCGSRYASNSGSSIALWVMSGVSAILFTLQQWTCFLTSKETRLLPAYLFKGSTQILLFIVTASAGAARFLLIYYIPLFFQFTHNDTAIQSAVRLLPVVCFFIFFTFVAGALIQALPLYPVYYLLGGIFILIGSVLLFRYRPGDAVAANYGYQILFAVGVGLSLQIGYTLGPSRAKSPEHVAAILGFLNTGQIVGGAVSLSIAGAIFQNVGLSRLQHALRPLGTFTEAELRAALAGAQSNVLSGADERVYEATIEAIGSTISTVYALTIAAGAVLIVSSLTMRWNIKDS